MKLRFYYPLPIKMEFEGKRYGLRLTAANVLRYLELCDDPEGLTFEEVTEIGFGWLVKGGQKLPPYKKRSFWTEFLKNISILPKRD